ncbi:MAG: SDR family NAD(P)-dependent oxidoreductase [Nitriliruptorales bacterium]|nr:SDR family NAD(P)-dependent oxidoreductase [Nitriliruptorales bacterium]
MSTDMFAARETDTLIWISGASSGIGAALAATVPFDRAHVVDISRSGGAPGVEHLPADLSDPSSWAMIEAHFVARLGGAEAKQAIFVHSAGTLEPIGPAGTVDSAAYTRNVLLNSAAPQVLGHAFLKAAAGFSGEAHLYLLSSGAARSAYAGWSSYGASKAAVDQWVRAAGLEQTQRAEEGLPSCRVVAVTPGVVATSMQDQIRATDPSAFPDVEKFKGLYERGELRKPEDAARGIWSLVDRHLDNGAVIDLRKLT